MGLYAKHAPAGGQAGVGRGAVPVPQLLACIGVVGLLGVFDGVIDQQDVAAAPCDAAAHASGDVAPTGIGDGPLAVGAEVRVQPGREHALVGGVFDGFLDLAAEGLGQRHVVGAGNDLMVRVVAQVPGREHPAGQLGLARTRGHQDHQARAQTFRHVVAELLQAPCDVLVDPAGVVARVQALHERQQPALGQHPGGDLDLRRLVGGEGWGWVRGRRSGR